MYYASHLLLWLWLLWLIGFTPSRCLRVVFLPKIWDWSPFIWICWIQMRDGATVIFLSAINDQKIYKCIRYLFQPHWYILNWRSMSLDTINILSHDFSNLQQSEQMSNSQLQRISLGAIRLSLAAKIRRFVFPQIVSLTYRIVSSAIFV